MLSQVRRRSDHADTLDDNPRSEVFAAHKEEENGDPPEDDYNKGGVLTRFMQSR